MPSDIAPGFDQRLIGLGIALGIGFIVGLEREWAEDKPVGVRSFALIGTLGGLCGLLIEPAGGLVAAAGLLILGAVLAIDFHRSEGGGITTIVAAIIVFALGVAAVQGFWLHSIVIGGAIMVLLHWKKPLHQWVDRIGDRDFETIVRFILITLVILPVLPDRTFGPYDVFNPFRAWLLVVLIVGINLAGYVAFRFVSQGAGAWLAGALGGLVSSTATTIAYAGMSRQKPDYAALTVVVILVASTVVYGRVLIELAVVSPALVGQLVLPGVAMSIVLLALSAFVFLRSRQPELTDAPVGENPARVRRGSRVRGCRGLGPHGRGCAHALHRPATRRRQHEPGYGLARGFPGNAFESRLQGSGGIGDRRRRIAPADTGDDRNRHGGRPRHSLAMAMTPRLEAGECPVADDGGASR